MSQLTNAAMKTEPDPSNTDADNPYAAAARALAQAQRALSAVPRMITVTEAEKRCDTLRAEIDELREAADNAKVERRESGRSRRAWRLSALSSTLKEVVAMQNERRELLRTERLRLEAQRIAARNAILSDRMAVAEDLHQIIRKLSPSIPPANFNWMPSAHSADLATDITFTIQSPPEYVGAAAEGPRPRKRSRSQDEGFPGV
ncbi:hypothetical protein DFH09DRAFT_1277439 [Mycena vulgaris]|nr:hypothetical protein DFH09DRAFT_1277439 [Mycena vulgaris]